MLGRTHFTFAFLLGLVFAKLSVINWLIFTIITAFSAFLPDLDHPKSKINNFIGITKPLAKVLKHRGIFHSIWFPLIIFFTLPKILAFDIVFAITLGYLSHIFLDSFTKYGINYLHPISFFQIRGPFKTGKMGESVFFILCLFAIFSLLTGALDHWTLPNNVFKAP